MRLKQLWIRNLITNNLSWVMWSQATMRPKPSWTRNLILKLITSTIVLITTGVRPEDCKWKQVKVPLSSVTYLMYDRLSIIIEPRSLFSLLFSLGIKNFVINVKLLEKNPIRLHIVLSHIVPLWIFLIPLELTKKVIGVLCCTAVQQAHCWRLGTGDTNSWSMTAVGNLCLHSKSKPHYCNRPLF